MGKVKVSERVTQMMLGFMELHNKGYAIPEIAQMFDLDASTVYRHLESIARANGVNREDLLKVVQAPRSEHKWKEEEEKVKINVEEMEEQFNTIINSIEDLLKNVKEIIKEENNQ